MVNYANAVVRPFTDVWKAIIGIILSMIPIVNIFVSGFAVRAARNSMDGNEELPEWDGFGSMFMEGLTVSIISIIYLIPTIFLSIVGLLTLFIMGSTDMKSALATGGIAMNVALLFFFAAMFILPMAIMNYVAKGSFLRAFDFVDVFKRAFSGTYIIALIVMAIYLIIAVAIAEIFPIIGILIAGYAIQVTGMTVFAEVYANR